MGTFAANQIYRIMYSSEDLERFYFQYKTEALPHGGPMLNVTGLNHFYYVRDFTDIRCKHSRVLSIIRERLHREPYDGDVFIVMSRNRKT